METPPRSRPHEGRLAAVFLPPLAAGATVALHLRWLARDGTLPVGDAAGHLVNVARHLDWLRGGALPAEPFPPGLYVVSAALVDRLGPTADAAAAGTVAFAGLLAAVLAWLGVRAAGPVAGVVLPLVALAAPLLSASARQVLLDLPATALIVAVWAFAWASDGYRRPLPTLLVGAALGAGALVKYTIFPWVLPALALPGIVMVARGPTSLLPLLLVVAPAWSAFDALSLRAVAPRGSAPPPAVLDALQQELSVVAAGVALLVLGVRVGRRRGHDGRLLRGLEDGGWLALAALGAVALVVPWFLHAMPVVWEKVHREAIAEVRTSGLENAAIFARAVVLRSWPGTWWLLQVAVVLEVAWLAWAAWASWRSSGSWGRGAPPPRNAPPDAVEPVPAWFTPSLGVALSCALGTWFTMRSLPVDTRYYLPLLAGTAVVLGLGACRFRIGRLVLGPALGLLAVAQLAAAEGLGPREPARFDLAAFDAIAAHRLGPSGPFAPPAPRETALGGALAALVDALVEEPRARPCGAVLVVVPRFAEARAAGIEPRTLGALGALRGLPECALVYWELGTRPERVADARYLAVAGLHVDQLSTLLYGLSATPGKALLERDADGRAVRLHALVPPATAATDAGIRAPP